MKCYYALVIVFLHGFALALLEENLVAFEPIDGSIELGNAPILRDATDPVGVKIAVDSLAGDLEEVTDVSAAWLFGMKLHPLLKMSYLLG